MNAIKGIYRNGHIELESPADWPEGTAVIVEPAETDETVGMREVDWDDSPEGIAEWLRWYHSLEPLETNSHEESEWQASQAAQKERDKAAFGEWAEGLRRMWC